MARYRIPAKQTRTEIMVVNSRFIATVAPVFSVEEAREFIQDVRHEFSDASHNVPAFLIGHGQSVIAHSSDDGEPSGTAGRPALTVLQGSGLGDIAVVVTRYFGGTKLGTGGLVRAYTDAVKEVLSLLPLAEKVPTLLVRLVIPYSLFEQVKLIIQEHRGKIIGEAFAAEITINLQFIEEDFESFNQSIIQLSRGKISAEIIDKNPATIMPISGNSR